MFSQFLLLRCTSIFLVQTYFVPDEYWQSLEVAHHTVFGYGYLTWEWQKQLRSIFFPGVLAVIYKILYYLNLDFVFLLTLLPRLCCAALMASSDCAAVKLSEKLYGRSVRGSVALCLASCWFLQYCASRTISGVPETAATMWALSAYPWSLRQDDTCVTYLWWVGVGCALRPTTALLFVPLFAAQLLCCRRRFLLLFKAATVTAVVSGAIFTVDSLYYGRLTFVPWNFLKFNALSSLADHYGSHSWHWYVTSGLPSALGPHFLFLVGGLLQQSWQGERGPRLLLYSCCFAVVCYSMVGHKEVRLLLPLLPPLLLCCGHALAALRRGWRASPWYQWGRAMTLVLLVVPSCLLMLYFGLVHQRGPLVVMEDLRTLLLGRPVGAAAAPFVLFLTPCHATPLYSHLHVPVPVRFLTCEPNLNMTVPYIDESDRFFSDPKLWLAAHLPAPAHTPEISHNTHNNSNFCARKHDFASMYRFEVTNPLPLLPSHIVVFDSLARSLSDVFRCLEYTLCAQSFHSFVQEKNRGKYIQIYCASGT